MGRTARLKARQSAKNGTAGARRDKGACCWRRSDRKWKRASSPRKQISDAATPPLELSFRPRALRPRLLFYQRAFGLFTSPEPELRTIKGQTKLLADTSGFDRETPSFPTLDWGGYPLPKRCGSRTLKRIISHEPSRAMPARGQTRDHPQARACHWKAFECSACGQAPSAGTQKSSLG